MLILCKSSAHRTEHPSVWALAPVCLDADFLSSSSAEKLRSLSDEEWRVFLQQLCSSFEEQNTSAPLPSSSIASSTATRSRLNLLCYLCCVVGHKDIANRLINSALVGKLVFTYHSCCNIVASYYIFAFPFFKLFVTTNTSVVLGII